MLVGELGSDREKVDSNGEVRTARGTHHALPRGNPTAYLPEAPPFVVYLYYTPYINKNTSPNINPHLMTYFRTSSSWIV